MHCLTVCAYPGDEVAKEYTKKQLERWKKEDGSYEVNITLDDELLDEADFTVRRYIPHDSITDKLLYMLAAVIQHYNGLILKGPLAPTRWKNEPEERYKEDVLRYEENLKEWEAKGYRPANQFWIKQFKELVHRLEENLSYRMNYYLFRGEPDKEKPKVKVKLNYYIDKASDTILGSPVSEEKWFGTGCYGNEEFYYAVCDMPWRTADWICNPYSQILAGSDEQDEEDNIAQSTKARDLLAESWKAYKDSQDLELEEDSILNPGKVIWPLGG